MCEWFLLQVRAKDFAQVHHKESQREGQREAVPELRLLRGGAEDGPGLRRGLHAFRLARLELPGPPAGWRRSCVAKHEVHGMVGSAASQSFTT